jgi:hypothetical protein
MMDVQRGEVDSMRARVRIGCIKERNRIAAPGQGDRDPSYCWRMCAQRSRYRLADACDAGAAVGVSRS